MVGINEGPKFPGPVELVTHHKVSTINWMIGKDMFKFSIKIKNSRSVHVFAKFTIEALTSCQLMLP